MTIVDKTIHAASGAFRAGVELPNMNMTLPAGLTCKVRFFRNSTGLHQWNKDI